MAKAERIVQRAIDGQALVAPPARCFELAAGLDRVEQSIDPGEALGVDPADLADAERERRGITAVPSSPRAAIAEFAADPLFKTTMSELMWRAYQVVKLTECDGFQAADEDFEIEQHFYAF